MTILFVGNNISVLEELSAEIETIYPSATVLIKTDPLMAGKYSYAHSVDILITELRMKRMDGMHLINFVHHEHPNIPAYLIGTMSDFEEYIIDENDVTGMIVYPFTSASVKESLKQS